MIINITIKQNKRHPRNLRRRNLTLPKRKLHIIFHYASSDELIWINFELQISNADVEFVRIYQSFTDSTFWRPIFWSGKVLFCRVILFYGQKTKLVQNLTKFDPDSTVVVKFSHRICLNSNLDFEFDPEFEFQIRPSLIIWYRSSRFDPSHTVESKNDKNLIQTS